MRSHRPSRREGELCRVAAFVFCFQVRLTHSLGFVPRAPRRGFVCAVGWHVAILVKRADRQNNGFVYYTTRILSVILSLILSIYLSYLMTGRSFAAPCSLFIPARSKCRIPPCWMPRLRRGSGTRRLSTSASSRSTQRRSSCGRMSRGFVTEKPPARRGRCSCLVLWSRSSETCASAGLWSTSSPSERWRTAGRST